MVKALRDPYVPARRTENRHFLFGERTRGCTHPKVAFNQEELLSITRWRDPIVESIAGQAELDTIFLTPAGKPILQSCRGQVWDGTTFIIYRHGFGKLGEQLVSTEKYGSRLLTYALEMPPELRGECGILLISPTAVCLSISPKDQKKRILHIDMKVANVRRIEPAGSWARTDGYGFPDSQKPSTESDMGARLLCLGHKLKDSTGSFGFSLRDTSFFDMVARKPGIQGATELKQPTRRKIITGLSWHFRAGILLMVPEMNQGVSETAVLIGDTHVGSLKFESILYRTSML